jgi:hypothetical protein
MVGPVPATSYEVILGKGRMPRLPFKVVKTVQPVKSPVAKFPFLIRFACRGDDRTINTRKMASILSIISFGLRGLLFVAAALYGERAASIRHQFPYRIIDTTGCPAESRKVLRPAVAVTIKQRRGILLSIKIREINS